MGVLYYLLSVTQELYQFLTSDHVIPPGLIAYVYKMRWDIEKVFDEIKIKCKESKSWGSSPEAKEAQAHFICLAHNLMLACEDRIEAETGLSNCTERKRRQRRTHHTQALLAQAGRYLAPMYLAIQRFSQRCVVFIRWLRNHLRAQRVWSEALGMLARSYGPV
jgi:hypothetical protein